jgi:hypothetical protein
METQDLLKTFQPFFKTLSKCTLPVCHNMEVSSGIARMTNLEIELTFPVDLSDGYYEIRMNEAFRVGNLNDDFPRSALSNPKCKLVENGHAVLNPESLIEVSKHIVHDETRPVMNAINIAPDGITASDAHSLLSLDPIKTACVVESGFTAMVNPSMPLMTICKLAVKDKVLITAGLYCTEGKNDTVTNVKFQYDNITVIQRAVDGKYPNYKGVIPDWSRLTLATWEFDSKDLASMAQCAKNFNVPATKLLKDGRCTITNIDLNLHKEFKVSKIEMPTSTPYGLLMPMMIQNEDKSDAVTGINSEKLARFISPNSKVVIGVQCTINPETKEITYNDSRAMAVWVIRQAETKPSVQYIPKAKPEQKELPKHVPAAATPAPTAVPYSVGGSASPSSPKPDRPHWEKKQKPKEESQEIHIVEYSEKAIAVFGNTKPLKNKFLNLYGRYNPNLHINNEKVAGWVFSKKRLAEIQTLIAC